MLWRGGGGGRQEGTSEIYGGSHLKRGFEIHELNGYDLVNCFYLCIK